MGNRISISSFNENSPAANTANLFYTPKTQALLRGANWDFGRKQSLLNVWKQAFNSDGSVSSNPPPQPFLFSYLWPSDCLRSRFILPYVTPISGVPLTTGTVNTALPVVTDTRVPYVPAVDYDSNNNPLKVILTNLPNAQLVYTADLSQNPDMWDPLFLAAETALLAAYFIQALSGNIPLMSSQISIAKGALDAARAQNGNQGMVTADHLPDWIQARFSGAFGPGDSTVNGTWQPAWDPVVFPSGLPY